MENCVFKIGVLPDSEVFPVTLTNSASIVDAIISGLKEDRLVKQNLVCLSQIDIPDTAFAFKLNYPHSKEKENAAYIQLSACGRFINIKVEGEYATACSGAGHTILIYPAASLSMATLEEIKEASRTQLFMLACILLKLSTGFDFVINRDQQKLTTDNPAIAIYEACIDAEMRSTVLVYSEPDLYESDEVCIRISKDSRLAQVSGQGVSPMSITLTEMFTKMMHPPIIVEYISA